MAKKLLDQARDAPRTNIAQHPFAGLLLPTEQTCKDQLKRYILFHDKRHSKDTNGRGDRQSE